MKQITPKKDTMPIRIERAVINEIKRIGFMGESYSDVLKRVLKMNRKGMKREANKPNKVEDKI
jgi:negative regulator of replication initiation